MSSSFPPPPQEAPINPYAAPATEIGSEPTGLDADLAEVEAIRRAHIGHEASIQSLGSLHYLGAVLGLLGLGGMISMYFASPTAAADPTRRSAFGMMIVFYGFATALNFALGNGLRRLKPWARWIETALLSFQMLTVVIGVVGTLAGGAHSLVGVYPIVGLIVGYILYLLLSPKGSVVFSPAYKEVIARTPHIKYKTSLILKLALVFTVALLAVGIGVAIFSGR